MILSYCTHFQMVLLHLHMNEFWGRCTSSAKLLQRLADETAIEDLIPYTSLVSIPYTVKILGGTSVGGAWV